MQGQDIHNYLERYFSTNNCHIVENNGKAMRIQLTEELDQLLMNRPFYWRYIKNTNMTPKPITLHLVTDPMEAKKGEGEFIHFGGPRLHQIFQSTKKLSAHVRLFEMIEKNGDTPIPLEPWLVLNIKISYQCDHKKDRLLSIGLHLINGSILRHFHEQVSAIHLTSRMPDNSFTLIPLIKPQTGIKRLESMIKNELSSEDHHWADEAHYRWQKDLELLDQFYENHEEKPESYIKEKEALRKQYEPVIKVEVINGGMFYLSRYVFEIP